MIEKVVKFKCYGNTNGEYYHYTNAKTGEFLREGNGFMDDQINRLQHCDKDSIVDTWYNVVTATSRMPFLTTYEEALELVKVIKKMNKELKEFQS